MPTKLRKSREAQRQKELAEIPMHIQKRIEARRAQGNTRFDLIEELLKNDPPYLKLPASLCTIADDGSVEKLPAGDKTGSANEERADARTQNIKCLAKAYPKDWLQRGGAMRIALSEAKKRPENRAIKPCKGHPGPISERTVQDYFRNMRRAKRVP